ncbi:LicD family protein [Litoreibacter ascidiaceicola]|uniref:LicD family protein n=1 Tax=Litoreibacter ascidiaceicola TaxID=1486859 RepID=A0A1M4XIJ3_9RHOB|nr:LicD family protein [Litoreibacter ascidiaceicola]SHE93211.1 LicD family protein [Litoreibacter ascidiaceicola]
MDLTSQETLLKFRDEAIRAFRGEDLNLQPRKRLQMMDKMPTELRSLDEFREAFVINAVLGKCRPAAANKQMSLLRASREKAQKLEDYENFEAILESQMDGVTFGAHGYRTRQLEDADAETIYTGVHKILQVLKKLGYDAFANSGTLLGLVRDKGLIPYDDDIDLAVILSARRDEDAAEEFKVLLGCLLAEGLDCYFVESKNAIIKLPNIDGFEVDLFPAYGAHRRYNIFPYSRKQLVFADIWPLTTCPVSKLPLPARPEVLLRENYGDTWEIPNPRYTFPWVTQKAKFSTLLKELAEEEEY